MYQDSELKFVALLNRATPLPQRLNALGHMTAGLVSMARDGVLERMTFLDYITRDGSVAAAISKWPYIVLSAKNSEQIRRFKREALTHVAAGRLLYNDFLASMLGASAEHQLSATAASVECQTEMFGAVAFGPADVLNLLTRRYSLFKLEHAGQSIASE
ncbi:MAG: DUF2000 family protein [Myxococcales bacterium]|nr:DUF2000 family protein [Myxococcales bacterium]